MGTAAVGIGCGLAAPGTGTCGVRERAVTSLMSAATS
jgi:hypothetical protein